MGAGFNVFGPGAGQHFSPADTHRTCMEYERLVAAYTALEGTQSTLEKADILADLFRDATPDELELLGHLVMGRPFPAWTDLEMGVGDRTMVKAIATATGESAETVEDAWRETGDLGDAVQEFVKGKKQQTLASKELTVELVQNNLEQIAGAEGAGSEERKIQRITELIGFAEPDAAKYIVRTVLGNMRVGVGEGTVRDGIVAAFFADVVDPKAFTERLEDTGMRVAVDAAVQEDVSEYGLYDTFEAENEVDVVDADDLGLADLWRPEGYDLVVVGETGDRVARVAELVQHAYDVSTDLGRVARVAAEDGPAGLREMEMELGRPVKVMLAQKAETMEDGYEAVQDEDGVMAVEYKYDGMRVQVHKDGDDVQVFTRRLEDVTAQFPDIVRAVKKHVTADQCIIEGEAVAYDPDDHSTVPFQQLSKRIKRKYDIQEMVQQIPVTVHLFDIIFLDGEAVIDEPLRARWERLADVVEPAEYDLELADHIETDDIDKAAAFYQDALQAGQEGVMLKNRDAAYKPGSRVGYMMKLKPVMETLDLVIVEADWGEGRRSDWLGSVLLACRDGDGELRTVGKMATGFTDEQLQELTDRLQDRIVSEEGRHVELEPDVVVEVAYEEIQESPAYSSGYALRFPRLVQFRDDLGMDGVDGLGKIESLFESQQS